MDPIHAAAMDRNQSALSLALTAAILVAATALLLPRLYDAAASGLAARLPTLRNKRICLLIAHPDDEAMFFAPTLLALTRRDADNHVRILCLSTGNAAGLGAVRRRELVESALMLGLRAPGDVVVVDRPDDFPDSMTASWDEAKISRLLAQAFISSPDADAPPDSPPRAPSIDVLITFDRHGVSAHPNHIALYRGARAFAQLARKAAAQHPPIHVYTLVSVGLVRKYLFLLDLGASLAAWCRAALLSPGASPNQPRLLFLNCLAGDAALPDVRRAMTHAHRSQMVWFRHLYIRFSRYMLINDLRLEDDRAH